MKDANARPHLLRFGVFEVDLRTGELRKQGLKIKLHGQPFQVLAMLLERPGELVTREEIREKLWPGDTFIDFEHSVNSSIKRLREALGDDRAAPRFIETLPRHGYRFIAPVETIAPPVGAIHELPLPTTAPRAIHESPLRKHWVVAMAAGAVVVMAAAVLALNVAGLRDRLSKAAGAVREPPLQIQSIAVLPLENLSRDPEQEYFADGMTEELITNLGKISALRVISRTSVMQYKGTKKPLPQIARELNVDAIVEGTVQRSENRVRITANLLHAPTDRHLWAETYERDLRDVLALQSEVARAIADEVKAKLTPDVQARLARTRPVDPEVHDLYLKGNYSLTHDDPYKGLECFEQAIKKDPNFARGYVGLAQSYSSLGGGVLLPSVEAYAKEKAYARKALELDDSLAEAHAALAEALYAGDWDWGGGEREFQRALELNPNSDGAHHAYSQYLMLLGRAQEAIGHARRALEINPASAMEYVGLGQRYFFNRQYDQTLQQCQRVAEVDPNERMYWIPGVTYREKGMYKEAIAAFLSAPEPFLDSPMVLGHLGNTYARAGQRFEAQKVLQKLIDLSRQNIGTWEVALVYAGLGDKDRAFEWLEKAYQVHDKGMLYLKVDPPLDPLRSDPRFQDLLRRMNFPP
jgi:TolB-like protein/DNA-binding winged helix-turn-helix (wHTH) protein/Tfp pilus assembly protein PilF